LPRISNDRRRAFHGIDYYKRSADLIGKLAQLDMFLQIQSEHDQLSMFVPWIEAMPIRVLIDHCGRPTPEAGLDQPGFKALLRLAATQRVSVKLSGYSKFSQVPYPFDDTWPYVAAIVDAFTLDRCLWASDWPYLRAPQRQDYGPLLELAQMLFPDLAERRRLFCDTPRRLFGFGDDAGHDARLIQQPFLDRLDLERSHRKKNAGKSRRFSSRNVGAAHGGQQRDRQHGG
jgi:predicted TIM-barrel fold metal-dependent hydrolase